MPERIISEPGGAGYRGRLRGEGGLPAAGLQGSRRAVQEENTSAFSELFLQRRSMTEKDSVRTEDREKRTEKPGEPPEESTPREKPSEPIEEQQALLYLQLLQATAGKGGKEPPAEAAPPGQRAAIEGIGGFTELAESTESALSAEKAGDREAETGMVFRGEEIPERAQRAEASDGSAALREKKTGEEKALSEEEPVNAKPVFPQRQREAIWTEQPSPEKRLEKTGEEGGTAAGFMQAAMQMPEKKEGEALSYGRRALEERQELRAVQDGKPGEGEDLTLPEAARQLGAAAAFSAAPEGTAESAGNARLSLRTTEAELPGRLQELLAGRLTGGRTQELLIELSPERLGSITVRASLEEGRMVLSLHAENIRTLELLRTEAPELARLLTEKTGVMTAVELPEESGARSPESFSGQHGESENHRQAENAQKQRQEENTQRQRRSESFLHRMRLGLG